MNKVAVALCPCCMAVSFLHPTSLHPLSIASIISIRAFVHGFRCSERTGSFGTKGGAIAAGAPHPRVCAHAGRCPEFGRPGQHPARGGAARPLRPSDSLPPLVVGFLLTQMKGRACIGVLLEFCYKSSSLSSACPIIADTWLCEVVVGMKY